MPTYCIPVLSGVPGFPASEFDWWTPAVVDPNSLRFSPDNPNWLGAFSLSEGTGANRDLVFRALQGPVAAQTHLFLSWVSRVSALSTAIDHVNIVFLDAVTCLALQIKVNTTASTVAGTQ